MVPIYNDHVHYIKAYCMYFAYIFLSGDLKMFIFERCLLIEVLLFQQCQLDLDKLTDELPSCDNCRYYDFESID